MSQRDLANAASCTAGYICQIENGTRFPEKTMAECLDAAVVAGGNLMEDWRLLDSARRQRPTLDAGETVQGDEEDDMERRAVMQLLTTLGVTSALPVEALETLRNRLEGSFGPREDHDVDEWAQAAWDHSHTLRTMPPARMVADLAADVVELRRLLGRSQPKSVRNGLLQVSGQLSALMAMALFSLGEARSGRRWWGTARRAADECGDRDLRVWVRSREAAQALIGRHPSPTALNRLDEAMHIADGAPCAGLTEAQATRAAAQIIRGDRAGARDTLGQLAATFDRLPEAATQDRGSVWGWPEQRLRHNESRLYTLLGDTKRAATAQQRALALYPDELRRSAAQVHLNGATCLILDGDVASGLQYATSTVEALPAEQRTTVITKVASGVLETLPPQARNHSQAQHLRSLLQSKVGT